MLDAFSRVVSEAESRGIFVTEESLDRLRNFTDQGLARTEIVSGMAENSSTIITNAARDLFAEQPQLIVPGGNAYGSRRMSACIRDLEIILRYITYAMLSGDVNVLNDRCLNGLRETYLSLGVPGSIVASGIQKMKNATLNLIIEPQIKEESQDLDIQTIRKLYQRQWVAAEVTEFKDGFPLRGKVLLYDDDISRLSSKTSSLNGNIYTFFTGRIDEKPDSSFKGEIYKKNKAFIPMFSNLSLDYSSLLSELSSYFDLAAAAVM